MFVRGDKKDYEIDDSRIPSLVFIVFVLLERL